MVVSFHTYSPLLFIEIESLLKPNIIHRYNGSAIIKFELDFKLQNLLSEWSMTTPLDFLQSLNMDFSSMIKSNFDWNLDFRIFKICWVNLDLLSSWSDVVKSKAYIRLFFSKFDRDTNLLGYVIDDTHICKLGSLKFKFGGILILKWLFVLSNVENSFELLDTFKFDITLLSMALIFSLIVDGTPGSNGNGSNTEFVNWMLIDLSSWCLNLKYIGFSTSVK